MTEQPGPDHQGIVRLVIRISKDSIRIPRVNNLLNRTFQFRDLVVDALPFDLKEEGGRLFVLHRAVDTHHFLLVLPGSPDSHGAPMDSLLLPDTGLFRGRISDRLELAPQEVYVRILKVAPDDLPDLLTLCGSGYLPKELRNETDAFLRSLKGAEPGIEIPPELPGNAEPPGKAKPPVPVESPDEPERAEELPGQPVATPSQDGVASQLRLLERVPGLEGFARTLGRIAAALAQVPPERRKNCVPHLLVQSAPGLTLDPAYHLLRTILGEYHVLDSARMDPIRTIDIDWEELQNGKTEIGRQLEETFSKRHGSVCIVPLPADSTRGLEALDLVIERLYRQEDKNVMVFLLLSDDEGYFEKLRRKLSDRFFLEPVRIVIPGDEELYQHVRKRLKEFDIELDTDEDCRSLVRSLIDQERSDGRFYQYETADKIARELAYRFLASRNLKSDSAEESRTSVRNVLSGLVKERMKPGVDTAEGELNQLIGLDEVKKKVLEIARFQKWNRLIQETGGLARDNSLHMAFTGNPGTGKTSVARLLGRIFKELGLLKHGEFFEVSREHLIGAYMGHTAKLTARACEKAVGSVLFIDEAYSLMLDERDAYGKEAISTLISFMEAHRHDTVVILAGYRDEMKSMLQSNPGMNSRVAHYIDFPDYTSGELVQIFHRLAGPSIRISEGAEQEIQRHFQSLPLRKSDEDFGNGRYVRNLVERATAKLAERVIRTNQLDPEALRTMETDDVLQAIQEIQKEEENKRAKVRMSNPIGFRTEK